jgi:hypothetical protein
MYARTSCQTQYHEIEPIGLVPYRTPWCDMIGCCTGEVMDILHLYYPIEVIREEVHKRTSYLGKHRSSENAPHLLDLISMTVDEEGLFQSFIRTAMMKVFEPLGKHTKNIDSAYIWDVNAITVDIEQGASPATRYDKGNYVTYNNELYIATGDGDSDTLENLAPTEDYRGCIHYIIQWGKNLNPNFIDPLDQAVNDALIYFVIWKWLLSAYPDDAEVYEAQFKDAIEDIRKFGSHLTKNIVSRIPRIY